MEFVRRPAIALFACCFLLCTVPAAANNGQHDFDFEFGTWRAHLSRLLQPLSGSHTWTRYSGTSIVHKIWGGRGNIGEFDVAGPAGHIVGMTLRLYNPQTGQWSVYWANEKNGELTKPLVGSFKNGKGLFYDDDTFDGRPIKVRFLFSHFTAHSFRITQSFSDDGGKTWEANWISDFTR